MATPPPKKNITGVKTPARSGAPNTFVSTPTHQQRLAERPIPDTPIVARKTPTASNNTTKSTPSAVQKHTQTEPVDPFLKGMMSSSTPVSSKMTNAVKKTSSATTPPPSSTSTKKKAPSGGNDPVRIDAKEVRTRYKSRVENLRKNTQLIIADIARFFTEATIKKTSPAGRELSWASFTPKFPIAMIQVEDLADRVADFESLVEECDFDEEALDKKLRPLKNFKKRATAIIDTFLTISDDYVPNGRRVTQAFMARIKQPLRDTFQRAALANKRLAAALRAYLMSPGFLDKAGDPTSDVAIKRQEVVGGTEAEREAFLQRIDPDMFVEEEKERRELEEIIVDDGLYASSEAAAAAAGEESDEGVVTLPKKSLIMDIIRGQDTYENEDFVVNEDEDDEDDEEEDDEDDEDEEEDDADDEENGGDENDGVDENEGEEENAATGQKLNKKRAQLNGETPKKKKTKKAQEYESSSEETEEDNLDDLSVEVLDEDQVVFHGGRALRKRDFTGRLDLYQYGRQAEEFRLKDEGQEAENNVGASEGSEGDTGSEAVVVYDAEDDEEAPVFDQGLSRRKPGTMIDRLLGDDNDEDDIANAEDADADSDTTVPDDDDGSKEKRKAYEEEINEVIAWSRRRKERIAKIKRREAAAMAAIRALADENDDDDDDDDDEDEEE